MADNSLIEWTDATWNIITGCTLVDEGCRHCYAARLAATRMQHDPTRAGLARLNAGGEAKFTGEVRFNEKWLDQPLRWAKPRRIFVCAHGDLFHEAVPDEWIDRVFAVMALAPQHTFQVLTKRPDRARDYLRIAHERVMFRVCDRAIEEELSVVLIAERRQEEFAPTGRRIRLYRWPLPNVWLGTSVSDQASADARIPALLAASAAVRFLSAEPLLGPVDLTRVGPREPGGWITNAMSGARWPDRDDGGAITSHAARLDWVIVGGESGPKARPMHPDWARSLRDQCQAAGVPFLFKQWGEWAPSSEAEARGNPQSGWQCLAAHPHVATARELYPEAGAAFMARVGKRAAGRTLDGRTWDQMPGVAG